MNTKLNYRTASSFAYDATPASSHTPQALQHKYKYYYIITLYYTLYIYI